MILAYPWLLALLPLPLLTRYLLPVYQTSRVSIRVPLFDVLVRATGETPAAGAVVRRRSWVQTVAYAVAWVMIVLALARPQLLEPPITKQIPTRDLMLAIDLSGSMETQDFKNAAGKTVTRLDAVKEVLQEFLDRRSGDRVGMIVFGTGAFVQIPFTQDLQVCQQLLDQTDVRMAGPQTALGDAIGLAITVFDRSELEDKVLIALTDGNDTGSRVPPTEAAKIAADRGVVIHTIGVGDPQAAGEELLDEQTLRDVSSETRGQYFFAADRDQLESVYDQLDKLSERKVDSISHRPKRDLFHWFILTAMASSIGYMMFRTSILAVKRRLISNIDPSAATGNRG